MKIEILKFLLNILALLSLPVVLPYLWLHDYIQYLEHTK
jgi:hypothetical protein